MWVVELLSPEIIGQAVGKIECMSLFVIVIVLILVLHIQNRRDVNEIKSSLNKEKE